MLQDLDFTRATVVPIILTITLSWYRLVKLPYLIESAQLVLMYNLQ